MNSDKFKRQIESMWKHRDTDEQKRLVKFTIAKTMRLALEYPELAQEYYDSLCKVIPDNERITVSNYQHNLTSDAEGEGLLTCEKSKAMQLYSHLLDLVENERMSEHYSEWCGLEREYIALFGENVFADYFGSKCLPDAHEDNFTTKEPQPAEPKFKIGDKVRVKFNAKELHSNPDPSKKIYYWQTARDKYLGKVFKITDIWKSGTITLNTAEVMFWEPFDLEPYTEPTNEGTRQEQCVPKNAESGTHSFNHILKDGFHDHNRLHIAAMIAQGIMANSNPQMVDTNVERLVDLAILTADTLIAKCEKGGTDEED